MVEVISNQDSILDFLKCLHKELVFLVADWLLTIFETKKHTEIQEWHFEWQILKILGHFGKSEMQSFYQHNVSIYANSLFDPD